MVQTIVDDVSGIISTVFLNGDWISLLIAFGSVAVAALMMRRVTQVGAMTLLALVVFYLAGLARGVAAGPAPEGATLSGRILGSVERSWEAFMQMPAGALLAYVIAFMALVLMLFAGKSVLSRG